MSNVPKYNKTYSFKIMPTFFKNLFCNFCWNKIHFVGPLIAPILCDPLHGFQRQGGSFTCTRTCLPTVNLMSDATSAFPANKGVNCISMYTADSPSRHPSCKQWRAFNGGLLTSAAVRFELGILAARSTGERAIHWDTPAGVFLVFRKKDLYLIITQKLTFLIS